MLKRLYDWTMDKLSWTWGGVIDFNQKNWAVRAGYFLLPTVSNYNAFDTHAPERGQYTADLELRYSLFEQPGKLRLFAWMNHGRQVGALGCIHRGAESVPNCGGGVCYWCWRSSAYGLA